VDDPIQWTKRCRRAELHGLRPQEGAGHGGGGVFRSVFPILYAEDVERSMRFYTEVFGFAVTYRWPADGPCQFAYLELTPQGIGLASRAGAEQKYGKTLDRGGLLGFELCLRVDDVDQAAELLLSRGVKQLSPPEDTPWGERLAYFEDPDGVPIMIYAGES
jgi:lactoylglutathione lyase